MKKVIAIEILLFGVACLTIACDVELFTRTYDIGLSIDYLISIEYTNDIQMYYETYYRFLTYGIIALISTIADIIAMVLIAIKDFPCFKPLIDKFNVRREAHEQAKAEQAAIAKQERVNKLQAELDELKKED